MTSGGRGTAAMPSASRSASEVFANRSSAAHRAMPGSTPTPRQRVPEHAGDEACRPFGRACRQACRRVAAMSSTGEQWSAAGSSPAPRLRRRSRLPRRPASSSLTEATTISNAEQRRSALRRSNQLRLVRVETRRIGTSGPIASKTASVSFLHERRHHDECRQQGDARC